MGKWMQIFEAEALPIVSIAPIASQNQPIGTNGTNGTAEIIKTRDGWTAQDWQGYYNERAGISEYDGRLGRADAEARAYQCSLNHWLTRNPPTPGQPDHCVHCDQPEAPGLPLLALATKVTVWVHDRCIRNWRDARMVDAVTDLTQVGIKL